MKKLIRILFLVLISSTCAFSCTNNVVTPTPPYQEEKGKQVPTVDPGGDPDKPHASVRPSDTDKNWIKRTIVDGIVYWEFRAYDSISGAYQFVHVADIDMNKGYKFIIGYDGNSHTTSEMFKKKNALVAINAGYETSSIFVKYSGQLVFNIQNDCISGTSVTNWKNDGAVCIEDFAGTKVSICNAMCSNEGEDGVSQYGKALAAQREYYRNGSFIKKQAGVISSAPLLIYDYHPYGTTFVPTISSSAINSYAYEHPFHHQGVRHPRTAVGIDGDGHILLIVADGRYTSICDGFTAKELTNFLIKYFDPKYALNMDGGGSSTMCVSGLGDESTNVVNYPCDDGKATHSGERTVRTFFCITR